MKTIDTNAFVDAINRGPKTTTTTNGADSYTTTGVEDDRVALMFKLVRDLDPQTMVTLMDRIVEHDNLHFLVDLFVMTFQTRDVRGGKGERDLFYNMYMWLAIRFPQESLKLLPLITHYGSFLDLRELWSRAGILIGSGLASRATSHLTQLRQEIVVYFGNQLSVDCATPDGQSISLAGKWAPREKNSHRDMALALAKQLFPGNRQAKKKYRELCSNLNKRLKTIEVMMCNGTWSDIDPSAVPARNLKIRRLAFLNKQCRDPATVRSTLDDRVKCAEQFEEYLARCRSDPASARVHGRVLHPHELVQTYLDHRHRSGMVEDPVIEAQFKNLCTGIEEMGAMAKMCVMLDTSGSMFSGARVPPILPAMGLAAAITRTNHPAFRNFYIRFSEDAKMMRYADQGAQEISLSEIVNYMLSDGHIGNTNFEAAMELILKVCTEHKVPEEELPDYLLVLSDMQFDKSTDHGAGFEAHWQRIQRRFQEVGYTRAPKILFWNLAAYTMDFPAPRDAEGVEMISGFSPTLLKYFLQGEDLSKAVQNPFDMMRKQLDDERYDPVRANLAEHKEGVFQTYSF